MSLLHWMFSRVRLVRIIPFWLICFVGMSAQQVHTSRTVNTLNVGGLYLKDTYLSPLRYGGLTSGYGYKRYTGLKADKSLLLHYYGQIEADWADNPVGNASFWGVDGRLGITPLWLIKLPTPIACYLGPGFDCGLGGIFSTRNGNNPATLKLHGDLQAALLLTYRLPLDRFPALVSFSWHQSFLGTAFGVDYGESYYEHFLPEKISRGVKEGMHLTHPGITQRIRTDLSLDLPLPRYFTFRVAYRLSFDDTTLGRIRSSRWVNVLELGLVREIWSIAGRDAERGRLSHTVF